MSKLKLLTVIMVLASFSAAAWSDETRVKDLKPLVVSIIDKKLPCGIRRVQKRGVWNDPYRYYFHRFPDYLDRSQHIFMQQTGGGAEGRWFKTGQIKVSKPCWLYAAVFNPSSQQRKIWQHEGWKILPDIFQDLWYPRGKPAEVREYVLMRKHIPAGPVNFDTKAPRTNMVIWIFKEVESGHDESQKEVRRLIAGRDAYTFVLCYQKQAVEYAIANLESQDAEVRALAEDIATRFVNLRLYRQNPERGLELLSTFRRNTQKYYTRFKIALAEMELGSEESAEVVIAEFREKKLSYASRKHALQLLAERNSRSLKSVLEYALQDHRIAALAAKELCRLGDSKGKRWLLDRADKKQKRFSWPNREVLDAITDVGLTEAIPILKEWLSVKTYSDLDEFELLAKKTHVAIVLARLGEREGIKFLRETLAVPSRSSSIMESVALCLAKLCDKQSVPLIEQALRQCTGTPRRDLAEALLILDRAKGVSVLIQHLESGEDWLEIQSAMLLIKYNVKEAIPRLERFFEEELRKKEFFKNQPLHPWVQQLLKQQKLNREVYINKCYRDRFWRRIVLAVGLLKLGGSSNANERIILLLRDPDDGSVKCDSSWERLFESVEKYRITEAIPDILPYLDSDDPMFRRTALLCLQQLTELNLPPRRKEWEAWFRRNATTAKPRPSASLPPALQALVPFRDKYAGKIVTGNTGRHYEQYAAAMEQLLAEWNPIGHTTEEVQFVIGSPSEIRKDQLDYCFEDGFAGRGWRFKLKDGKVIEIQDIPLE